MHEIITTHLSNGIPVLSMTDPRLDHVKVGVVFDVGSRNDPIGKEGVVHTMEHMVFRGSKAYPNKELLVETAERYNAHINASVGPTQTSFYSHLPKRRIELGLHLLSELVCQPLFRAADWNIERQIIIQEWRRNQDNTIRYTNRLFRALVFEGSRIAHEGTGTEEQINTISIEDIQAAHAILLQSNTMRIIVAGNAPENTHQLMEHYFGTLPQRKYQPGPIEPAPPTGRTWRQYQPGLKQDQLRLGIFLPEAVFNLSDLAHWSIYCTMLNGGLSSPLTQALRDERGLVYSKAFEFTPYCLGIRAITFGTQCLPKSTNTIYDLFWDTSNQVLTNESRFAFAKDRRLEQIEVPAYDASKMYEQVSTYATTGKWWDQSALAAHIREISLQDVQKVVLHSWKRENSSQLTLTSKQE